VVRAAAPAAHAIVYGHFRPRRHRLSAVGYRRARTKAFRAWRQATSIQQAGWCRVHQHHQRQVVPESVNLAMPTFIMELFNAAA
jgi:hypothetical protein